MGKIKLILGASVLLFSSIANAAIITSSYMNSLEELRDPRVGPPSRQTMTLNMFDSSLGTLNYAIFSYQLEGQTSLKLHNDSPASVTFDYISEIISETEGFFSPPVLGVGLSQFGVTLDAGESQDFGTYAATKGPGSTAWVRLDFPEYYDRPDFPSSFSPILSKLGGGTFENGCKLGAAGFYNNIEVTQKFWGACGATIEYHFTEFQVPEPSAILLFGTGLIGLIGFSKRKVMLKSA